MKVGSRPRGSDELPVDLVPEQWGASVQTATVELGRPRRRLPELLLVVLAVAVVAGVGLLDGRDDDEVAADPTTTTTAERRTSTTVRRRPTTTAANRSTTSTIPTTTTTIVWPQRGLGTGPLLPGAPTGTSMAYLTGSGQLVVVDLDTGDLCRTEPSPDGIWFPWSTPLFGQSVIVQSGQSIRAVDRTCGQADLDSSLANSWAAAVTEDSVWFGTGEHEPETFRQHRLPDGEPTGREVEVRYGGAIIVASGDEVIVGAMGEMTLVDAGGERHALGPGTPLAANADVIAFAACPRLECQAGIIDRESGARNLVGVFEPSPWEPALFSPDGRLVRFAAVGAEFGSMAAVYDLAEQRVVMPPVDLQSSMFSADGRWLIGLMAGRLTAVLVDDPAQQIPLEAPEIQALAVFRNQ